MCLFVEEAVSESSSSKRCTRRAVETLSVDQFISPSSPNPNQSMGRFPFRPRIDINQVQTIRFLRLLFQSCPCKSRGCTRRSTLLVGDRRCRLVNLLASPLTHPEIKTDNRPDCEDPSCSGDRYILQTERVSISIPKREKRQEAIPSEVDEVAVQSCLFLVP